jgi:hypothetical protein
LQNLFGDYLVSFFKLPEAASRQLIDLADEATSFLGEMTKAQLRNALTYRKTIKLDISLDVSLESETITITNKH